MPSIVLRLRFVSKHEPIHQSYLLLITSLVISRHSLRYTSFSSIHTPLIRQYRCRPTAQPLSWRTKHIASKALSASPFTFLERTPPNPPPPQSTSQPPSMPFGDFSTICAQTSIPLCALIGPGSGLSSSSTTGIMARCYSRSIELANTIIFQGRPTRCTSSRWP